MDTLAVQRFSSLLLGLSLGLSLGSSYAADADAVERLETMEVIGVTPLHGVGLELEKIPSNVQTATGEQVEETQSLDLTQFMNRNLGSVYVNEAQGNPLQPDVQFRGFVASPLLGLPQGLSVYQDGVRINERFGDTVNWALIPQSAIASINLIPGSNPLYGLNTLGGALSLQTKNGFTHPGNRLQVYGGSYGRVVFQGEVGGTVAEDVSYYLTGWYFDEDGWRDFSPSTTGQIFANLGWRGEASTLDLNVTYADTDLIGNGAAPIQLLSIDREAIFTRPDQTNNRDVVLLNLLGSHELTPEVIANANFYFRDSDIDTLNGDDSDFEECKEPENEGFLCEIEGAEEQVVEDQFGNRVVADERVEGATVNRSTTEQDTLGGTLQATLEYDVLERANQFIVGGSVDNSSGDLKFRASTELGTLDETRQAIGSGIFVGESFTSVNVDTDYYGIFFTDTLSVTETLALTVSGRYNKQEIKLRDQLGDALTGDHDFDRFNPAGGLTYTYAPELAFYGGYFESNRAPSPVELTCADPEDPCRLPNAFLADPPLEQAVAKTWEVGLRGLLRQINWHVGFFSTTVEDDIIFISAGPLTNQGFFDNVGDTRRQGVELNLKGTSFERLDWSIDYTYVDATFREDFTVSSPNNPAAIGGEIPVSSGDRIPGIPDHLLKAGATFAITPNLLVGGDLQYVGDQFFRGDEANLLKPIDDYTVVNIRGEYNFPKWVSVFVKIDNLFDEDYATFGLLGQADEVLGAQFDDPRFVTPGAPRGAWGGLKLTF